MFSDPCTLSFPCPPKNSNLSARPGHTFVVIALALIACIAIPASGASFAGGLLDSAPAEASSGLAAFLIGWLLAGFSYGLRKLQLIEWSLRNATTPCAPRV
jgi:hypothetical protein